MSNRAKIIILVSVLAVLPAMAEEPGLKLGLPGLDNSYPELRKAQETYQPLSASEELDVASVEYGVFMTRVPETDNPDANPDEQSFDYVGRQPVTETTFIPGKVGVKFGMRYTLEGPGSRKPLRVKLLYLTPGLVDPKSGKHQDKIEISQELSPRARFHVMAFEFTEAYEVVPGAWHMYVFVDDRALLSKTFTVVK